MHAGRQLGLLEAIDCLLADEMVVAAVFELQADETQRIYRVRANESQPRRARHGDLDRDRDVALHLLRRLAGTLRNDLDDRRSGVRIGFDIERRESDKTQAEERYIGDQHKRPPRQAENDDLPKHRSTARA